MIIKLCNWKYGWLTHYVESGRVDNKWIEYFGRYGKRHFGHNLGRSICNLRCWESFCGEPYTGVREPHTKWSSATTVVDRFIVRKAGAPGSCVGAPNHMPYWAFHSCCGGSSLYVEVQALLLQISWSSSLLLSLLPPIGDLWTSPALISNNKWKNVKGAKWLKHLKGRLKTYKITRMTLKEDIKKR